MFVKVNRGMTDATMVCIFPWEKRVLELVHGQDTTEVTIDELCSTRDVVKVEKIKLNHATAHAPDQRAQYEAMCEVDPEEDPADNPEGEYSRLIEKYGMDKDLPIPAVTRIFGEFSSGAFTAALKEFKKESVPKVGPSIAELRAKCAEMGIDYTAAATRPQLQALIAKHEKKAA
jgi:hypothetical protein